MFHAPLPSPSAHTAASSPAHAFCRWIACREVCLFDRAHVQGLKTLTSTNALSKDPPQKPCAATSKRALSCVFAERWDNTSPDSGCRLGSTDTQWHTSDNRDAVMSLTSLCLIDGKPPVGHDKAWSTENWWPQLQLDGVFSRGQL